METISDPPRGSSSGGVVSMTAADIVSITDIMMAEVLSAVDAVQTPNNRLISRSRIEDEITEKPEEYPILSQATRQVRRQAITKVMKRRFPFWSEQTGVNRRSFVWVISPAAGVSA